MRILLAVHAFAGFGQRLFVEPCQLGREPSIGFGINGQTVEGELEQMQRNFPGFASAYQLARYDLCALR